MPIRRNPVARAPILRKGGAHQRVRSGERHKERLQLNEWLLDGLEEYRELQQTEENTDVLPDPILCITTPATPANFPIPC